MRIARPFCWAKHTVARSAATFVRDVFRRSGHPIDVALNVLVECALPPQGQCDPSPVGSASGAAPPDQEQFRSSAPFVPAIVRLTC
jgi:hypothetical protein